MQEQEAHRLKSVLLKAASTARSDRGVHYKRTRALESAEYNPVWHLLRYKFLSAGSRGPAQYWEYSANAGSLARLAPGADNARSIRAERSGSSRRTAREAFMA